MIFNVSKLQRKLNWIKLPNLMFYVILLTGLFYFADMVLKFNTKAIVFSSFLNFDKTLIFRGEFWRLISYVFLMPRMHIILVFLYLYLINFMGNSLEMHWGVGQLTIYYLFGYLLTTGVGLLVGTSTIIFLNLSLAFVFVTIYPDINLNFFSFINLRANWVGFCFALLFVVKLIVSLVIFNLGDLCAELVAIINFMIFFGPRYFINLFNNFKQFMSRQRF